MRNVLRLHFTTCLICLLTYSVSSFGQSSIITVKAAKNDEPVEDATVTFRCMDSEQQGEEKTFATDAKGQVKNPFNCKTFVIINHRSFNKIEDTLAKGESQTYRLAVSSATITVESEKDEEKKEKWRIKKGYYAGPSAFVYFPSIDRGEPGSIVGGGIRGQMVGKNRKIRYTTGLLFAGWKYALGELQVGEVVSEADREGFSGIDNSFGELRAITTRINALEIPLEIEYYFEVADQVNLFAGGGISPILFLSETFEYAYVSPVDGSRFVDERSSTLPGIYGTINGKAGFEWRITDLMAYQTNLSYKFGVTSFGQEKHNWNFFGFEMSMFFTINRRSW